MWGSQLSEWIITWNIGDFIFCSPSKPDLISTWKAQGASGRRKSVTESQIQNHRFPCKSYRILEEQSQDFQSDFLPRYNAYSENLNNLPLMCYSVRCQENGNKSELITDNRLSFFFINKELIVFSSVLWDLALEVPYMWVPIHLIVWIFPTQINFVLEKYSLTS